LAKFRHVSTWYSTCAVNSREHVPQLYRLPLVKKICDSSRGLYALRHCGHVATTWSHFAWSVVACSGVSGISRQRRWRFAFAHRARAPRSAPPRGASRGSWRASGLARGIGLD